MSQFVNHPEWKTNNSLTSPGELSENLPKDPPTSLSVEEVREAVKELHVNTFIQKFPRNEKFYADPIYSNQVYCLHSFVPAKGATPNEKGVYGMVKCRGCFGSVDEANDRAEYIIRNVDSYHNILTGYVGRPFPLAFDSKKYVSETNEVDIKQQAVETISKELKAKREKDKKEIDEVKEREKQLLDDVSKPEDPYDRYTTLRVKKAQLVWTYSETMKKMEQMKNSIIKAREEIAKMDEEDPDYSQQYMDKYRHAREQSGLKEDTDASFMKYMAEDLDLGF